MSTSTLDILGDTIVIWALVTLGLLRPGDVFVLRPGSSRFFFDGEAVTSIPWWCGMATGAALDPEAEELPYLKVLSHLAAPQWPRAVREAVALA